MRARLIHILVAILLAALLGRIFTTTASEPDNSKTSTHSPTNQPARSAAPSSTPAPPSSKIAGQAAASESAAAKDTTDLCKQLNAAGAEQDFQRAVELIHKHSSITLSPDDLRLLSELHTPEDSDFRNELTGMPAEELDRLADGGDPQAADRHVFASNVLEMNDEELRRMYSKSSARLLRFARQGHQQALYSLHFLQLMVLANQHDETTGQFPATAEDYLIDHAALNGFLRTHGDIMFYMHARIREEAETVPEWLRFRGLKLELELRALTTPSAHLQERVARRMAVLNATQHANIHSRHTLEEKERAYQLMKGEFGRWQRTMRDQCAAIQ